MARDLVVPIDVAQVDQHVLRHHALETAEVQRMLARSGEKRPRLEERVRLTMKLMGV